MADTLQCNDPAPHGPHTWYSPSASGSGQDQHQCQGVGRR
jgi:hypothetical protein